jgi:hypothetical protein
MSGITATRFQVMHRSLLPLLLLLGASSAPAAIIAASDITVSSSAVASNGTLLGSIVSEAAPAGNGNGYLATPLTEANKLTVTTAASYNFNSGGQYLTDNANGRTFTFTFTSAATVGQILVWNYSQNEIRGLDAISNVEIDTGGGFNSVLTNFTLLAAGDTTGGRTAFTAQLLNLPSLQTNVSAIRLTVAQGITSGTETAGGFDQIAFSTVPEPATALLGGLGLLAMLPRRRR